MGLTYFCYVNIFFIFKPYSPNQLSQLLYAVDIYLLKEVVLRNGKVGVEQLNKREIFNFD
jgi:hypothetical protein